MKKFALVASLVALTVAGLNGCSSAEVSSSDATTDMPVEAGANNDAFNALANPDAAASASAEPSSTGAVVDTANPSTTVADNSAYSPPSFTDSATAPEKSPVNLGASSAGRAH
ncbi:MAG: hypothetical protein JST04_07620 [Bdellovibrionales bacterium]|nr:hypothetical protein [Bdellovibrionales bacterium]